MFNDRYPSEQRLSKDFKIYMRRVLSVSGAQRVCSAVNRVLLRLDEDDIFSPRMMYLYRAALSTTMRSAFDSGWDHYRQWQKIHNDKILPEAPPLGRTRFAHPLFSDMARLAGVYGADNLPRMTWADLDDADPIVLKSADRIYEFLTGLNPAIRSHAVVPKGLSGKPMPMWAIEGIINSTSLQTKGFSESFYEKMIEELVAYNATTKELRSFALLATKTRTRLRRAEHPARLTNYIIDMIRQRDIANAAYALNRLATDVEDVPTTHLW